MAAPPGVGGAPARPASLAFRIRRGLDLAIAGAPDPAGPIEDAPAVSRVAVLGDDAPGVRAELRVAPGDRVRLGQTLFVDRARPELRFLAPGAGTVAAIERGARRRLEAVVISLDAGAREGSDAAERFDPPRIGLGGAGELPPAEVRQLLLASGLFTALRTRPFSHVPDPGASPRALFVTALDSEPLAPDPALAVAERRDDFVRGVAALACLTEGPVYVCTRPGADVPLPEHERVALATFAGPHPAGLPGTHVHLLAPVRGAAPPYVWHVGAQDAIALGRLLATGTLPTERVIALAGPSALRPRLLRTRIGASTDELVRGELRSERCRVLSGSVLSGREAAGRGAFLGRLHTQVCALPEAAPAGAGARTGVTTALGGRRTAFFPLERMERASPLDLPALPLLRALVVGDADRAAALGALELAEEDVALFSYLCPGKLEYGALLRGALETLAAEVRA